MISNALNKNKNIDLLCRLFLCTLGRLLFAISVNLIIAPLHLYSVGFTGISQLLRVLYIEGLHLPAPSGVDLTGIIFWIISIPVLFLAWFGIGKEFFFMSLFITGVNSIFMTVLLPPSVPYISDPLSASITGGVVAGIGAGLALRYGASGGGQDIIGVYLSKKHPNCSVGLVSIFISLIIYTFCIVYCDFETLLYSLVYSTTISFVVDKVHIQNVKEQIEIWTKNDLLQSVLSSNLNRSVYSVSEVDEKKQTIYHLSLTISKYEQKRMVEIIRASDDSAFVTITENIHVSGYFRKPI